MAGNCEAQANKNCHQFIHPPGIGASGLHNCHLLCKNAISQPTSLYESNTEKIKIKTFIGRPSDAQGPDHYKSPSWSSLQIRNLIRHLVTPSPRHPFRQNWGSYHPMALTPSETVTDNTFESQQLVLSQTQLLDLLNFIWNTIQNLSNLMKSWEIIQTTEL